jgi:hypothetical protein
MSARHTLSRREALSLSLLAVTTGSAVAGTLTAQAAVPRAWAIDALIRKVLGQEMFAQITLE